MMETGGGEDDAPYNHEEKYEDTVVEMTNATPNREINNYDVPSNNLGEHMNLDMEVMDKAASSKFVQSVQKSNLELEIISNTETTSTIEMKPTSFKINDNYLYLYGIRMGGFNHFQVKRYPSEKTEIWAG